MQKKVIQRYIHVMKYTGSKMELLEKIENIVNKNLKEGKVLLDIFYGTCRVGMYLRDKYQIYSNDIQLYSKTISEGTIEAAQIDDIPRDILWLLLNENYNKNYKFLSKKWIIMYMRVGYTSILRHGICNC